MARHSTHILETIRQYDTFLESVRTVADMGCGEGEDIHWWATLENNNDPPEPYNFNCFALDRDAEKLERVPKLKNIHKICSDFSDPYAFPVTIDIMWAHDSLQYSTNPLETLKSWNNLMTVNGMLLLSIPQSNGVEYNRYYSRTYSGCYFNYTPTNLIYMLAVNGFDCRDAYLLKKFQDPWIQMAVYKTISPLDPSTTSWYDLVEKNLLHPSIVSSINSNGFLKQEEIVMPWLDKENYFIDYVSHWEPAPGTEGLVPTVNGIINKESTHTTEPKIEQKLPVTKETKILTPVKIKSTPPTRKSYKHGK